MEGPKLLDSEFFQWVVRGSLLKTWKTRETKTPVSQKLPFLRNIQSGTMSMDMARAFQKCVTYGRFRTDLKPLFDSQSLNAPMLCDHRSAVLIMSKTGDNPMRWEIFYLGNGDRNVDPDVSTRHQHPFLVSPDDPRVSETYRPNSAGLCEARGSVPRLYFGHR